MLYFQTQNLNLCKLWCALQWKILENFLSIWSILLPFRVFYSHLVYFVVILVYFSSFGMSYLEKSGNPDYIVEHSKTLAIVVHMYTGSFLNSTRVARVWHQPVWHAHMYIHTYLPMTWRFYCRHLWKCVSYTNVVSSMFIKGSLDHH
jgi:hypothetical protein